MTDHKSEAEQRERIQTEVHPSADLVCRILAKQIADLIHTRNAKGNFCVLGLATGSTPVRLYRELIRLHREEGLSFARVITFNLDEYCGLSREHPESYWRFMHEQLFNHIDLPAAQINMPDGLVSRGEAFDSCRIYEEKILAAGGIDLQVLGIGRTGHIGFNEPGSTRDSRTRVVTLDGLTRRDAARDFLGEANVPRHAITMGIGTIMAAREIVLLAWGEAKAGVIAPAVEDVPRESLPASLLQAHPQVRFLIDEAAAAELTRVKTPWLVRSVDWTPALVRRAVTWLSLELKRPLLKLVDEHYAEHGMADLLVEQGPAYDLNIRIFNETQHTITGWPGGKPDADDTHRPERAQPPQKRVIVFAPEPSDEMLGMGGTLARLVAQGHAVTIAYLSSGNLAVPDEEAISAADLILGFVGELDAATRARARRVRERLCAKRANLALADDAETRQLKALLRRGEAQAALQVLGVPAASARFLDLPFYERGRYRQFEAGEKDLSVLLALLREIKPHQVFVTGAAQDPSSVAAVCFSVLATALAEVQKEPWWRDCHVWLYRLPGKTWSPYESDMAVPMSPDQLHQKAQAIYQHKTQRSQMPGPSQASQEVWSLAESSNRELARQYDALGLAEYEAIEAFARWVERERPRT
jgi:glucosamine-6-phosphate deaminase